MNILKKYLFLKLRGFLKLLPVRNCGHCKILHDLTVIFLLLNGQNISWFWGEELVITWADINLWTY